jgi:hypothetical protein
MEKRPNDARTVEEAVDLLRILPCSAYKLAQQGKILLAQKVRRHWHFHRETLVNCFAGRSAKCMPAELA